MNYAKKLKLRTLLQAVWALTGITMFLLYVTGVAKDEQTAYFGIALCAASLAGIIKKIRILRKPILLKQSGTEENDERNIYLMLRAKNCAANLSATAVFLAIIYFMFSGNTQISVTLALCVCLYEIFYLISYFFLAKRS